MRSSWFSVSYATVWGRAIVGDLRESFSPGGGLRDRRFTLHLNNFADAA
ncbi:hypothetical protein IQ266_25235 [filamentous cyanobacterium LEGE 11480]|uniref:Uncharacterized protein n=1 Tax=Romeriopsis navalis LEGE 11480 TaxID=2777977 RepID=A0A928VR91_9CYAN|nr:hypothetical protein [Romeriopsis navalis]MBE9033045.1 hypothetical protein [Romeriopsis navalis LEGE 11480]